METPTLRITDGKVSVQRKFRFPYHSVVRKVTYNLILSTFLPHLPGGPGEDWCRTWADGRPRTVILLKRTSKRVKEAAFERGKTLTEVPVLSSCTLTLLGPLFPIRKKIF